MARFYKVNKDNILKSDNHVYRKSISQSTFSTLILYQKLMREREREFALIGLFRKISLLCLLIINATKYLNKLAFVYIEIVLPIEVVSFKK